MLGFFLRTSVKNRNRSEQWMLATSLLASFLLLCSCGDFSMYWDEDSDGTLEALVAVSNDEPTACNTEEVTLDGTESYGDDLEYSWSLSVPDDSDSYLDDDYECSYEELIFSWELTSVPSGSSSELDVSDSVYPVLAPDVTGTYIATLTVTRDWDGASSEAIVAVTADECD